MKKFIISILVSVMLFLTSISFAGINIVDVAQSNDGYVYVMFYYQNDTGFDLVKFEAKLVVHETKTGKHWHKTKVYSDGIKVGERKTYSIYKDFGRYIYGNAKVIITDGWRNTY